MKQIIYFVIILIFLSGCLEKKQVLVASSEDTTGSWFEGVKAATNKGGIPASVEVSWSRADRTVLGYNVYVLVEDPITKVSGWELLDTVNGEQLKFIHSNLESGRLFTYKVHALALDGTEDSNTALKSTVAFEGIGSITIEGPSTATAILNSGTGAFDEVRVYAIPKSNLSSRVLVGTGKGNVTSIALKGLQSGTSYRFVAAAFMKNINAEDGNSYYIEAQTHSESFGTGALSDDNYAYQGFLNIQSYGLAPNAPLNPTHAEDPDFTTKFPTMLENPRGRLVRLTWLPFKNSTSNTKYKLVRSSWSNSIDMTTTTACDVNVDTSCVVCEVSGSGPKRCEDDKVQAPPKAYKYAVSLVKRNPLTGEEWVENLPTTNTNMYVTKVHIAPSYMVQVHRDTANYEMCQQMGKASDPRKWQRCAYQGFGDRPYASGPSKPPLSLDAGYYDQGYNFFIDRYRTACNWTKTAGACGSPHGCIIQGNNGTTNVPPSNSIGNDGDVLFSLVSSWEEYGRNCYIKKNGSWYGTDENSVLTDSDRNRMTTIDPGPDGQKFNPVAAPFSATAAFRHCSARSTEYGNKRMVRRREWMTAAAQPAILGEPNSVSMVYDGFRIRKGESLYTERRYECDRGSGQALSKFAPTPTSFTEMLNSANGRSTNSALESDLSRSKSFRYFIGTKDTIRCQTRWGAQGLVSTNTMGVIFSDVSVRLNATNVLPIQHRSEVSDFDAGNRDLFGFEYGTGLGPSWKNSWGNGEGLDWLHYGSSSNSTEPAARPFSVWGPSYIFPMGIPTANGIFPRLQETYDMGQLVNSGSFGISGYRPIFGNYQNLWSTRFYLREADMRFGVAVYVDHAEWSSSLVCAQEAE